MNKITGLIITFNEAKNIQEAIDNLDFVDEIIILDSYSTDDTKLICQKNSKIKFYERAFDNFSNQRNFAISLAKNDWILFLDADERINQKLKNEVILEIKNPKHKAYKFFRKYYYKRKPIHFCGTQTDKRILLFNKNYASYINKLVHETLKINGTTGVFKTKLIHYTFNSYTEYKAKVLLYSKLKAQELFAKNKKYNSIVQWSKTIFVFFNSYFLRLGILDGVNGIVICYLQAFNVFETYNQLKKLK